MVVTHKEKRITIWNLLEEDVVSEFCYLQLASVPIFVTFVLKYCSV